MRSCVRLLLCTAGCLSLVCSSAFAQSSTQAASGPKWTFEFYGGGVNETQTTAGTPIGSFPIGNTLLTDGGHPSRLHSSWRFGDGALLFNEAIAGVSQIVGFPMARITPLDAVLRTPGGRTGTRSTFGVRLGRAITPRTTVEIMLERGNGGLAATDATRADIAAANETFITAFNELLLTAPVAAIVISSSVNATTQSQSQSQTRVIGAVTRTLSEHARWSLSGTLGLGLQMRGGKGDEIGINARYGFLYLGVAPFEERDEITITYRETPTAVIGLLGVGAEFAATPDTGIRVTARLHLAQNAVTTLVGTDPKMTPVPLQHVTLPTRMTPAIQFSNQALPVSSLSPSMASTLTTFTGSGVNRQMVITLGIVRRF